MQITPMCLQGSWTYSTNYKIQVTIVSYSFNTQESLVHRLTLNNSKSVQILCFGFANPYCFQKIHFVDSTRSTVLKRFISWIWFVKIKIPKGLIRFDSWGFVYESRNLTKFACELSTYTSVAQNFSVICLPV